MTDIDIAYYERVVDKMRQALIANEAEPSQWSDGDKLRVLAVLFDDADIKRGVLDRHEVQDDLRRIAVKLDEVL